MLTLEQFRNKKMDEAMTSADHRTARTKAGLPARPTAYSNKEVEKMAKDRKYKGNTSGLERALRKYAGRRFDNNTFIQKVIKKHAETNEAIKYTHAVVDGTGKVAGMTSLGKERDAKDIARRHNGKVIKLKKPMSSKKGDMMINRPFKEETNEAVTSADRTPQNVVGSDGKVRTRMVPTTKKSDTSEVYARPKGKKIDEISPELRQRYVDKAFKQYKKSTTYKSDTPSYRQNPKARAKHDEIIRKRHKGIGSSIKRDQAADLQKHGSKLISKILQKPGDSEAQAKKRLKKGSMTDKSPEQMSKFLKTNEATNPHDDEGANHIIMQLRKSVSLRGMRPVEFKDGKKVKVSMADAQKFLTKYNKAKPMDKEKMQAMAMKSHDGFKKALGESVQEDMSDFERRMRMMRQAGSSQKINQKKRDDKEKKSMAAKAAVDMRARRNEVKEDRMAGKYKKGQTIVRGQWPNPDKWAEEYIMPNADKKGVKIYSSGPSFVIEKL